MTDKHDFKGAFRKFSLLTTKSYIGDRYEECGGANVDTILKALKIADRLQSGEVSNEMAWFDSDTDFTKGKAFSISQHERRELFKAMSQQLIKEVSDEE
jgi:hypothetical protein